MVSLNPGPTLASAAAAPDIAVRKSCPSKARISVNNPNTKR